MRKPSNKMTLAEYRAYFARKKEAREKREAQGHPESALQRSCVKWFRDNYPDSAAMLFAVPNGGRRGKVEAAIMKSEGVLAGVADLLLLEARGGYGALCIEMKTMSKDSRQSKAQKEWEKETKRAGNRYEVVRNRDQFEKLLREYMSHPRSFPLLDKDEGV